MTFKNTKIILDLVDFVEQEPDKELKKVKTKVLSKLIQQRLNKLSDQ